MDSTAQQYRLRPARREDESTIIRMVRDAQLNPFGLKWERFTVAVGPAGDIVGCIQLKIHGDGSQELASLVVDEAWRGEGVASALIDEVKAQADGTLWLMCASQLAPFYEQFYFLRVLDRSQMPPYFSRIHLLVRFLGIFTGGNDRLAIMRWQP